MTQIENVRSADEGRAAAFITYGLYLFSIPSAALLAPVGVLVAYASRASAGPLARVHLDNAIRLFWVAFRWGIAVAIGTTVSLMLTLVLIGFPLLWLFGALGFFVMVWFTVMSAIGLLNLLGDRGA